MSLVNGCVRVVAEDGTLSEPRYFFSIDTDSLEQGRFSPVTVYLLPAGRFERAADFVVGGRTVRTAQAACLRPVEPLAKLAVEPADFPLRIRGHDYATLQARIEADRAGSRGWPPTKSDPASNGAGIRAGSMPDRAWSGRARVHTVRS